ncbi:DUF4431 domain-containing protein [Salmonella enterica]|uniref:DUF4431 domain-containing protein n=1 Tax=Salmonella enterica TaxID=28901 RepID=UPI00101080FA|nr:DUF4431 domain-containing protein [Salmonella enterica]ECF1703816.1 DUF4431 domain-containing protein [Salmonella enterica subsp. enterica]EDS4738653.1 DUF4431 domain-containing protein [Salmonella enterica subsp. enterica serovar Oranienburg]EDF8720496.1 DUF4431 domain-containing protein [Salmonella enterica]EDP9826646.1 DUF4431 domain-containing protein [Salmonella enterica subsp. enterica]EEH2569797.1 DUF4431 domain-containing protein [Salmonella enterica]
MNKIIQSVFLLLLFFFSVSVMSACLDEGDKVTLTGVLKQETIYGPPGWGEHPQNDEKINYWFLYPDRVPECFNAVDDTRHYSKKMQIIMVDDQYNEYRMFLEKDVKLSGQIMFANSPYHSTPVLIFHVSGVELMKGGDN